MNLAVVEDENQVGAGVGLHDRVDERGDVLEEEFRVVRAHHVASRDKTLGCEKGKHRDHLPAMHHLDYAHALPHSAPTVLPPYGPAVHRRLVGEQEPGRVERARIDLVPVGSPLDLVASSSDLLHLLERYAGRVQRAVKVLAAEADLREAQVHLVRNVREVEPRILIDNLEHRLLVQSGHPLHPRLARREGDCDRLPESLERVVDRPLADAGPRRPVNVRDVRDVEAEKEGLPHEDLITWRDSGRARLPAFRPRLRGPSSSRLSWNRQTRTLPRVDGSGLQPQPRRRRWHLVLDVPPSRLGDSPPQREPGPGHGSSPVFFCFFSFFKKRAAGSGLQTFCLRSGRLRACRRDDV
ncbi:hypothetical protein T492DRAFT_38550 [Pavlovales sp. CCMP2436]|nr:hypothetical protein T492DRAFT_38550 [Pavlovales sp. CCMP2436]